MKKIIICLLFVTIASQYSCKKFLDITPIDKLTGNNYYQSASDVESNLIDMYGQLFDKYVQTNTAGATAEFRSGEAVPTSNTSGSRQLRYDVALLGGHTRHVDFSGISSGFQNIATTIVNDRLLLNALQGSYNGVPNTYNFYNLTYWKEYYNVIQSANILVSKLQEGIPSLSDAQTKAYIAEAKFVRCYCYFFLVRLYGDVVYYTTAFQKDPLPRTNMVDVVSGCLADLRSSKNDMPFALTDPSQRGVRATRGSLTGLMMSMDMWNAGFDVAAKKNGYYQDVETLGAELMGSNAYRLLNITEWATVSKGRSEESLFELYTSVNYTGSQVFSLAPFGESFIHFPFRLPEYNNRTSPCVFTSDYIKKLYPDVNDQRLSVWFDDAFNQNAETFQMKKFAGNTFIDASKPLDNSIPDASFLIQRYADAILLRAEAEAELGMTDEAIKNLNIVRRRAVATPYGPGDTNYASLKDAIFYERAKELMGEGSHYFDLVRTKRILSKAYTDNPLTSDKFGRGGWTWPIDASALINNPYMTLNTYWRGSGIE